MTMIDEKKALRSAAKERRAAAHAMHEKTAPAAIAAIDLEPLAPCWPCVVSGFLPIGEEIDPLPLMAAMRAKGATLALPVIEKKAAPLVFRVWTPGDPLEEKMWGIREPLAEAAVVEPDVLLVPLLAFDASGYRLGYGGGFYDRSLARLRAMKPVVAVGLAYDEQRLDAVPRESYDEPCDWVLSPSGPIRCG